MLKFIQKTVFVFILFCLVFSFSNTVSAKQFENNTKSTEILEEENTNESTTEDVLNSPVKNVIIDENKNIPDMTHSSYDEKPASVFQDSFLLFLEKYRGVIIGINGISVFILIGVVIFRIVKLGSIGTDGNGKERKDSITALGISLFALSLMGSLMLWFSLFFNALH